MVEKETAFAGKRPEGFTGIAGSALKLLAILTMLIDHTGAIILERQLTFWGAFGAVDTAGAAAVMARYNELYPVCWFSRNVLGRIAFPLFCFLLVEGFTYTRNLKKYAVRLFMFALLSEIPFDLGFFGKTVYLQKQNVFFTLFLGLLVIAGFRLAEEKVGRNEVTGFLCRIGILGAGMTAAFLLKTDYSMYGVLTIAVMYRLRWNRALSALCGCAVLALMSPSEYAAFLAVIPILLYNGKRGWNMKWIFYVFYPLHIFILYLIARGMNIVF